MTLPRGVSPPLERVLAHLAPDVLAHAEARLLPDLPREVVDRALFSAFVAAEAELLGARRAPLIGELTALLDGPGPDAIAHAIYELTMLGVAEVGPRLPGFADDPRRASLDPRRPSAPGTPLGPSALGTFMALVKAAGASLPGLPVDRRREVGLGELARWSAARLELLGGDAPSSTP